MTTPDHTPGLDDLIERLEKAETALRKIAAKAADCEQINLIGKTPNAKLAGTIRNMANIAKTALTKAKAGQP